MGLKRILVKFKADWVDDDYKSGEIVEDKIEFRIDYIFYCHNFNNNRYQIVDYDDLYFAMEDHRERMYLFLDTISKDKRPNVQIYESTPHVDVPRPNMDIVILSEEIYNTYFNITEPNAFEVVEDSTRNTG